MAENHPVGFQWVMEARERGAKVIHVDPRFNRTSAMSDIWVPLRPGTDIIFLGAIIHHVLENELFFREYVQHYTNAPFILRDDLKDTEELEGVFSGWDPKAKKYNPETWLYEEEPEHKESHAPGSAPVSGGHGQRGGEAGEPNIYRSDPTMNDPHCVLQMLKRHFSRYTEEMVKQHCGVPREAFRKVVDTFVSASGAEKTGAICYAVGWTQHSKGPQIIRAAAILQMLLGNIGRPGGGILALRGHASIQGSTDIPTLYDILPGYLPMPYFENTTNTWDHYLHKHTSQTGLWSSYKSYAVSLLRAYYGENATQDNNWGFDWLPRVTGDHSEFGYWLDMADGKVEGLFVMGQNPAVGAPNGRLQRKAMANLKWLVVRDMVETETAAFWFDSPEVKRGELRPGQIGTEVFLFPAAGTAEKEGTFTNTQRLLQYREKAIDAPGDARSDAWFVYHLGRRLKAKAAHSAMVRHEPLKALTWNYSMEGKHDEPVVEEILKEINGYKVSDRTLLKSYKELKDDGSTACGCWIYSGVFPEPGLNRAKQRESKDALGHGWGFAWPNDCRIIYNRASARPDGQPWSEKKKLVWWDDAKQEWTGNDTPDFDKKKRPDHPGDLRNGKGMDAMPGDKPFILHSDGVAWIWVNSGLKDGPLPTHYEPLESLFTNPLYPKYQSNPLAETKERPDNPYAYQPDDERFPYILTTYRLTEHHTAGGMSRYLSHLSELQPELFCEISPELAQELEIEHGSWVTITSPRGLVSAKALVTTRMHRLWVNGRSVHMVGLPYHWGWKGQATGDVTNDLLAISEEPNVRIMETKSLVCNISRGRGSTGSRLDLEYLKKDQQRTA